MYTVLGKFNGETELTDVKSNTLRKFKLTRLPPYIILYMKRFTKNTFYVEKNPTIVNFPIKAVEFGGDLLTEEAKKRYFLRFVRDVTKLLCTWLLSKLAPTLFT